MEESEKSFITLTIRQNIAYETKLRKFNVFNVKYIKKQLGEALQKGTNVKFTTIKNDKFYNLKTIEEPSWPGVSSFCTSRRKLLSLFFIFKTDAAKSEPTAEPGITTPFKAGLI